MQPREFWSFLDETYYGNPVRDWLVAAAVAAAAYAVLLALRRIAVRRLEAAAQRTDGGLDGLVAALVQGTRRLFVAVLAVYAGSFPLALSPRIQQLLNAAAAVSFIVQAGLWGNRFLSFALPRWIQKKAERDAASATSLALLGFIGRLALWTVVLLLALANLGVDVTALVAGLGVGGIAVALAVQNILGDIFASISIVIDKPFAIGDFLVVGDLMGTVEHIGIKTTRLRSLSGEQVVICNSDLLGSRIRNFKRMYERRVEFGIGVVYQTPPEKLERIPAILQEAVQAQPKTRLDRAHLKGFGPSSIDYEVVYYVLDADYNLHMDIQQAIHLQILREFAKAGIEFAYPTQTVYLANPPKA